MAKHSSSSDKFFRSKRINSGNSVLDRLGKFYKVPGCTIVPALNYMASFPERLFPSGLNNLKGLHDKLFHGQDVDYISPFMKLIPELFNYEVDALSNTERRNIISNILDEITLENDTYNEFPELMEFEEDQKKRLGNTSKILPFLSEDGLLSNVTGYFSSNPDISGIDVDTLYQATSHVKSLIDKGSLEPVTLDQAFDQSDKSTNWGLPFWLKGRDLIPDSNLTYALWCFNEARKVIETGILPFLPSVLVIRVQPNGSNFPKQRGAWAVSHIITLVESTFQIPLLAAMRNLEQFSELEETQTSTNKVATEMFKMSKDQDHPILCFDAVGYDMSLPSVLIESAYSCLIYWFREGNEEMLSQLCAYTYSCDLLTPIGVFTGREKALASGLCMTNALGSIVNLILFYYCVLKLGLNIDKNIKSTANGDDALLFAKGLTPEVLRDLLAPFNIVINPAKVMFKMDSASFCQRLYVRDYKFDGVNVGIRSLSRTIAGCTSYERKRGWKQWNSACDSVRCIMQLENLSTSPIFTEVVNLMIDADKRYGLGSSLNGGINELYKMAAEGSDLVERLSYSSYDRGRILEKIESGSNLKTVKIIDERTPNEGNTRI